MSHRLLAASPKSRAVLGGCSVPDVPWTPGAELLHIHGELSLAPVSVGIHEPPGLLCSPDSPGHPPLWTCAFLRGPSPTASSTGRGCPAGQGLSRRRPAGASGCSHPLCLRRKEIQGMLWRLSLPLCDHVSAAPIWSEGIWSPSTWCRKLGTMLTLILEMWLHGEDVPTPLPWLIPMETSHCSGRCVEREWSVEHAWSTVHTTAAAPVGSPGGGTQPVLDWHLLEQQILV